jgi:hypothetical protein
VAALVAQSMRNPTTPTDVTLAGYFEFTGSTDLSWQSLSQ